MIRILFLSGSSRRSSVNARLTGAVAQLAGKEYSARVQVERLDLTALRLPQPTPEMISAACGDAPDIPADAAMLVTALGTSDALFVGSDEYTGTFSTQLRCAVDWLQLLETPVHPGLRDKPVAICSAAPQGIGGMRGLPSLRQLFEAAGALVTVQHVNSGTHGTIFDPDGALLPFAERQLIDGALARVIVAAEASGHPDRPHG